MADLHDISRVRLERIAGNLPAPKIDYDFVETKHGKVYLALGQAIDGTFHGLWAVNCGARDIARTIGFTADSTMEIGKQILLDDAFMHLGQFAEAGLMDEGFWDGDGRPEEPAFKS